MMLRSWCGRTENFLGSIEECETDALFEDQRQYKWSNSPSTTTHGRSSILLFDYDLSIKPTELEKRTGSSGRQCVQREGT